MLAAGSARDHVVAFVRGNDVLVAVSRWTVRLADDGWGDTTLTRPDGEWTDRIAGDRYTGTVAVSELFGALPVALLEKASA